MRTKSKPRRVELGRYIVADPEVCHGKPTFKGTRIMVWQVVEHLALGEPLEKKKCVLGRFHNSTKRGECFGNTHAGRLIALLLVSPGTGHESQETALGGWRGTKGLQRLKESLSSLMVRVVFGDTGDDQIYIQECLTHRPGPRRLALRLRFLRVP